VEPPERRFPCRPPRSQAVHPGELSHEGAGARFFAAVGVCRDLCQLLHDGAEVRAVRAGGDGHRRAPSHTGVHQTPITSDTHPHHHNPTHNHHIWPTITSCLCLSYPLPFPLTRAQRRCTC
jgi:hypothetical protein